MNTATNIRIHCIGRKKITCVCVCGTGIEPKTWHSKANHCSTELATLAAQNKTFFAAL
jgi:hypothetical protein